MIRYASAALALGFLIDLLIGDPHGWPHIVRGFGALISGFEKLLYPMRHKKAAGVLLVVFVLLISTGIPAIVLAVSYRVSPWLYFAIETFLVYQLLAVKSLKTETLKVYRAIRKNDLPGARKAVSMVVGRDTDVLDRSGVIKAAVETVAENTADGVASPIFYIFLGGAALGCFYKAVNTMDSMVGYRNEKYRDFGCCAAHLDDVLNYLPSRICAVFMILSSRLLGFDAAGAYRIWKRDRRKHASPNSAQTEAVMAGALDIRLAGDARYFGKIVHKEWIGDDLRPVEDEDILRSHRLLYLTGMLLAASALLIRGIIYALL